ncbi:MAG: hypothetical protein ACLQVG_25320 [Terriglobia bacterium]
MNPCLSMVGTIFPLNLVGSLDAPTTATEVGANRFPTTRGAARQNSTAGEQTPEETITPPKGTN